MKLITLTTEGISMRNIHFMAALWVSEALNDGLSEEDLDELFRMPEGADAETWRQKEDWSKRLIENALKRKRLEKNEPCQVQAWARIEIWTVEEPEDHVLSLDLFLRNGRSTFVKMSYEMITNPDMIRWGMLMNE